MTVSEECRDSVRQRILRGESLLSEIYNLNDRYPKKIITNDQLYNYSSILSNSHTPAWYNPLEKFNVKSTELIRGVLCHKCSSKMLKNYRGSYWTCTSCKEQDRSAALQSLQDYAMLVKPKISNKEAKEFLEIDNRFQVTRLLKKLTIGQEGHTNQSRFIIPYPEA